MGQEHQSGCLTMPISFALQTKQTPCVSDLSLCLLFKGSTLDFFFQRIPDLFLDFHGTLKIYAYNENIVNSGPKNRKVAKGQDFVVTAVVMKSLVSHSKYGLTYWILAGMTLSPPSSSFPHYL